MTDRASQLARCLMEGGMRLPVGPEGKIAQGSVRAFLDVYFPGISQAEVARGLAIAVEIARADRGLR